MKNAHGFVVQYFVVVTTISISSKYIWSHLGCFANTNEVPKNLIPKDMYKNTSTDSQQNNKSQTMTIVIGMFFI